LYRTILEAVYRIEIFVKYFDKKVLFVEITGWENEEIIMSSLPKGVWKLEPFGRV